MFSHVVGRGEEAVRGRMRRTGRPDIECVHQYDAVSRAETENHNKYSEDKIIDKE